MLYVASSGASLFARLNLFGHQADLVHSCPLRDIDHLDHILVEQVRIGIDEGNTLVTALENILELIAQVTKFDDVLIDFQRPCLVDGDDNRFIELIWWGRRSA